ncbi:substrate-binding domain-containing protein [Halomonas sp. H5]|uniref:substrate-binding domain-containing protein n=1 Tax=Halomonas sp. H5 TaxID=3423910 RepID=UPI003D360DDE
MKANIKNSALATLLATSLLMPAAPLLAAGEKVAISFQTLSIPFFIYMHEQAIEEAEALDIDLFVQDAQASSAKQTSDIENALIQGVEAVILTPNDVDALAPVVNEVLDEEIPVIAVDRRVEGTSSPVPYVTADNVAGGRLMGEWVIENMPDGADVVLITGQIGSTTAMDRARGVREALADAGSNFRIVAEQTGEAERAKAMTVVENILTASSGNPPDVIISSTGDMTLGAVEAVQGMGLSDQIKIIGYDAYPEVLEGIKVGEITGVVEQSPSQQIRTALRLAVDKIRNGTEIESVTVEPIMVTADNLEQAEQFSVID